MGDLHLEIWDATGNKRIQVEAPDDVTVDRILVVLAEKLHLPRYNPEGQLMSYKFHHRRRAMQLLDEKTLTEQDVRDGDVLRIQPEITAGSGTWR
jgi:hypothetical protein